MADDLTYTSTNPAGVANGTKQVTDEHASRGHMPVVKAGVSADGDASLVPADASGHYVQGSVAHDAADAGNPHKVGGKARTSDPGVVAANDRVDAQFDTIGRQVVAPYTLHENLVDGVTAAITGTTDTSVIAAQGAGVRIYITSLTITNSHATVPTVVELKDGSGGTVKHRAYAVAAGGGYVVPFPTPLRFTANTGVFAAAVTTGSNIYVSASGYKSGV